MKGTARERMEGDANQQLWRKEEEKDGLEELLNEEALVNN